MQPFRPPQVLFAVDGLRLAAFNQVVVLHLQRPVTLPDLRALNDALNGFVQVTPNFAMLDVLSAEATASFTELVRTEGLRLANDFIRNVGVIAIVFEGAGLGVAASRAFLKYALIKSHTFRSFEHVPEALNWLNTQVEPLSAAELAAVLEYLNKA